MLVLLAAGGAEVNMAELLASGALLPSGGEEIAQLTVLVLATTLASTTVASSSACWLIDDLHRRRLLDLLHGRL